MGLTADANSNKIAIKYLSDDLNFINVDEVKYNENIELKKYNRLKNIEVFSAVPSLDGMIRVTGPLNNQGYFDIPENDLLLNLIKNLKFTDDVNPFIGVVQEGNSSEIFSLNDKATQNIKLNNNSQVMFFNKNDNFLETQIKSFDNLDSNAQQEYKGSLSYNSLKLLSDYKLKIFFENRMLIFPFYGEAAVKDIISQLGLDISSIAKDKITYNSPLDDLSLTKNFNELTISASKFNFLTFRNLEDNSITVDVQGEVNFPGIYTLRSGTSLAELYDSIGGLSKNADSDAVIFTRESIKESNLESIKSAQKALREVILFNSSENTIDPSLFLMLESEIDENSLGRIAGDFSPTSGAIDAFLLEDGDTIFFPKKVNTVSIIGEVMNPNSLIYNSKYTVRSLINLSGGYSERANKWYLC